MKDLHFFFGGKIPCQLFFEISGYVCIEIFSFVVRAIFPEEMGQQKKDQSPQVLAPDQNSHAYLKYRIDKEGCILWVNPEVMQILGYCTDEMVGQPFSRFIFAEDIPGSMLEFEQIQQGFPAVHYENRWTHKNGDILWLSWSCVYDDFLKIIFVTGKDITHQRVQASLMEIKDRMIYDLNLALNESNIVAKTNVHGIITYVNKQFCEISGYSEQELIGNTHRVINSGYHSKEFFKQLWQTIKKGKIWKGEVRNRKKNGEFYWADTTIVPITDPHGVIKEYIAIRKEITERKLGEIALQKLNETLQKKIEDMNRFSFITSHNLRAPVANIIGLMQMLKEGRVNMEEITQWTENVLKVGEELDSIVNELNQTLSVYSEADNPMIFHQKKIRKAADTRTVYMIDDDTITNLIHTRIAAKETPNVKVRTFTDASSALQDIAEGKEKPDLILLDINMPKMDGWQFLAALEELPQAQTEGIDIVILSSSIFSEDKRKAQSFALVRDFYTKPLTKESYREIFF